MHNHKNNLMYLTSYNMVMIETSQFKTEYVLFVHLFFLVFHKTSKYLYNML